VGALRVHPHKHYANDPPQKIEDAREVSATLETLRRYTLPIVVRLGVRDVRNWWLIRNV